MSWQQLHTAIERGNEDLACNIIQIFSVAKAQLPDIKYEDNADTINYRNPQTGMSALKLALKIGSIKVVNELLQAGVNWDWDSFYYNFNCDAPNGLLIYEAIIRHCNQQQPKLRVILDSAIGLASSFKDSRYLETFLRIIPDFDKDYTGCLGIAAEYGRARQVDLLLDQKVTINQLARDMTAIHYAVNGADQPAERLKILNALIKKGANVDLPGTGSYTNGVTPIVLAKKHGLDNAVATLQQAGAKFPKIIPLNASIDAKLLRAYWQLGADINQFVETGDTTLIDTVRMNAVLLSEVFENDMALPAHAAADVKADTKAISRPTSVILPDFQKRNKKGETIFTVAFWAYYKNTQEKYQKRALANVRYILENGAIVDDEVINAAIRDPQNKEMVLLLVKYPQRMILVNPDIYNALILNLISSFKRQEIEGVMTNLLAAAPDAIKSQAKVKSHDMEPAHKPAPHAHPAGFSAAAMMPRASVISTSGPVVVAAAGVKASPHAASAAAASPTLKP